MLICSYGLMLITAILGFFLNRVFFVFTALIAVAMFGATFRREKNAMHSAHREKIKLILENAQPFIPDDAQIPTPQQCGDQLYGPETTTWLTGQWPDQPRG